MDKLTSYRSEEKRYQSLRIIAGLFTVMGVVALVLGVLAVVIAVLTLVAGTPSLLPGTLALLWSLGLVLAGLQLVAFGALLRLLIQLEENTRATAQLLEKVRLRLEPAG